MPVSIYDGGRLDIGVFDGMDPTGVNVSNFHGPSGVIEYAKANKLTMWMPEPYEFLTDQTLELMVGRGHTSTDKHRLIGRYTGTRPKIKCTPGFAPNAGAPKAVVHMGNYDTAGAPVESDDYAFGAHFRNCEIVIDPSSNAGACGLVSAMAQWCSIYRLKITATGGLAALCGGSGPGSFASDLELIGGQYGWWNNNPLPGSTSFGDCHYLVNVVIRDSVVYAIWHQAYRSGTIRGFEITNAPASAIRLNGSNAITTGNLVMKDGKITWNGAAGTAVLQNGQDKIVVLENVYLHNCATVLNNVAGTDISTAAVPIVKCSGTYTPGGIFGPNNASGGLSMTAAQLIDGTKTNGPVNNIAVTTEVSSPTDMASRHAAPTHLEPDSPDVVNVVTQFSAAPGNAAIDSHARIREAQAWAAANNKRGVYLPKGIYHGVGGLLATGDVITFGEPGMLSELKWNKTGTGGTDSLTTMDWFFKFDDDVYGASAYHDICTTDGASLWTAGASHPVGLVHVTQGRNCWTHDIKYLGSGTGQEKKRHVYRFSGPYADDGFVGNGGGRHWVNETCQLGSNYSNQHADYRKMMICGTDEPLDIDQMNIEWGGVGGALSVAPFVEIAGSQKVEVSQVKGEATGKYINIRPIAARPSTFRCDFLGIYTPGTASGTTWDATLADVVEITSPSSFEATYIYYAIKSGSALTPRGMLVKETGFGSPTIVRRDQVLGYYRRGTAFDRAAMLVPLTRPAPPASTASPFALASTTWTIYLEGVTPATSDFAVAGLTVSEAIGGTDILADATVTVSSGGSGAANLEDNNDSTDLTATEAVTLVLEFVSPKALREFVITGSATGDRPKAVVIAALDSTLNREFIIYDMPYSAWAAGERKTIVCNQRAGRVALRARARAKF
jgi:hypothetical protein